MAHFIRRILRAVFILAIGCAAATVFAAAERLDAPVSASATNFYQFVNATRKFTDEQISWSFSERGPYTTFAQAKNAPPKIGGGGRMYFKIEAPEAGGGKIYKDFIEFTHNRTGWYGNTT